MGKGSLLLVDDDRQVLDSMADWLRELGYDLDTASGCQEAFARLDKRRYDLALVDIRLSDGDGFEILNLCREKHPETSVILITGYGTVDSAIEAVRAGAFDFLTKPLIDDPVETQERGLIGTPQYMAPELAESGGRDVDTRTDVYSLGVLLYELLTGVPALDASALSGVSITELVRVLCEVEPALPSARIGGLAAAPAAEVARKRGTDRASLARALRGDLDWITHKCLEKDPARRYQAVNALSDDVKRSLSRQPIEAAPPGWRYRASKFVSRHRTAVTGAIAILTVVVIGVIGSVVGLLWALDERAEAQRQAEIAEAVNDFLNDDLLAAVAPSAEAGRGRDVVMRDVLDEAAKRIDEAAAPNGRFADKPLVEAAVRHTLGATYFWLGEYGASKPHHERALQLRRAELGDEHADTLDSMNALAITYAQQGLLEDAIPLLKDTVDVLKRVNGPEHWDTLISMQNLAGMYVVLGRLDEAEPLYLETLEAKRRVDGPEHPDTLSTMNNLALLYYQQEHYEEAERLFLDTLEIKKRVDGEEHPFTLGTMNNLGVLYNDTGRYAEAAALLEVSAPACRRVLGDEHPWTSSGMRALATTYDGLGRDADALDVRRDLLEFALAAAESDDAGVSTLNDAAWMLLNHDVEELRDPLRALSFAKRACDLAEETGNPSLWMILDTLALAQHAAGDTESAIETQKRAISLIPEGADQAAIDGLESNLQRFEEAVE